MVWREISRPPASQSDVLFFQRDEEVFPRQPKDGLYWLQSLSWVSPSSFDIYPENNPEGILFRCPNHLNWFVSLQRSPCRITELLTLYLRVRSATLRSYLCQTTLIPTQSKNLVLSRLQINLKKFTQTKKHSSNSLLKYLLQQFKH